MSFALNVPSVASVAKSYAKSSVRTGETSSRLVTTRFSRRAHSANLARTKLACDARVRSADSLRSGPDWRVFGLVGALAMSGFPAQPVLAFGGEIELTDVTYEVVETCKPGTFLPSRVGFVCSEFSATASNKLKRQVDAADVFGFIYDANGNSAAAVNLQGGSRTVLAPIPYPIPLGMSKVKFDVVLTKESIDLGPLKLKGFKATVSNKDVEERFKGFDECELDPTACELGL